MLFRSLIIDDFGQERQTDWTTSIVEELIAARFNAGLTTIVTTNHTRASFEDAVSPRIASRLIAGAVIVDVHNVLDNGKRLG